MKGAKTYEQLRSKFVRIEGNIPYLVRINRARWWKSNQWLDGSLPALTPEELMKNIPSRLYFYWWILNFWKR